MRIAFFSKRRYTAKDLILERYGRMYELPSQLTRLGHNVSAWCLDYQGVTDGEWMHEVQGRPLLWRSFATGGLRTARLALYPIKLLSQLKSFKPDLLIGASDITHVALTTWLSRVLKVPCVIDLYDNFESFGQVRIPGFRTLLARAVRDADLVIAVSDALKEKVIGDYGRISDTIILTNGVNTKIFCAGDRIQARRLLGLPLNANLIGTAGGLSLMKGLDTISTAWEKIHATHAGVHLILAGKLESDFSIPKGLRVHYLGELSESKVVELFRALDVGIISVPDTSFGHYCFPQKAYEMLACGLPVVASNVGAIGELLASTPQIIFKAGDSSSLAQTIQHQLKHGIKPDVVIQDWNTLVARVEPVLLRLAAERQRS